METTLIKLNDCLSKLKEEGLVVWCFSMLNEALLYKALC